MDAEEDARMLLGVAKHGYKWHQIAAELTIARPTRFGIATCAIQTAKNWSKLYCRVVCRLVMRQWACRILSYQARHVAEPTPSESMAMASFSDMSDWSPTKMRIRTTRLRKASSPQLGDSTSSRPCKLSAGMPAPHEGSKRFASVGPHTVHGRDMDDRHFAVAHLGASLVS